MAAPLPSRTPLQQSIYDALRNAELASRLWPIMARRYQFIDQVATIALLLFSCGAVVTWLGWKENPEAYQALSMITAGVSIAQAILSWASKVEAMYQASAKWVEYRMAYLQLWSNYGNMTPQEAQNKLTEIQQREMNLTTECQRYPQASSKLIAEVMMEVDRLYP